MIKKSQRIKVIVDIKAAQEKTTLEALGASQRKLETLQFQIESLKQYRQEYQDKFNQMGEAGIKVAQLLEFRSFMDKLDKAITGQEYSLDACKAEVGLKRKLWESLHQRTQSLQKVCNSALAAELMQARKLEQLEHDEYASRAGRNGSGSMRNA